MSTQTDLPVPKRLVAVNAEIEQCLTPAPEGEVRCNPLRDDQEEAEMGVVLFEHFMSSLAASSSSKKNKNKKNNKAQESKVSDLSVFANLLSRWKNIDYTDSSQKDNVEYIIDNAFKSLRLACSEIEGNHKAEFWHPAQRRCVERTLEEKVAIFGKLEPIYRDDPTLPTGVMIAAKALRFGYYYIKDEIDN